MGERVNDKDLRKHRADVCSLVGLLPGDARLHLDGTLREDAQAFLEDFNDYISREASAKKRRALTEVRATLENATLVSCLFAHSFQRATLGLYLSVIQHHENKPIVLKRTSQIVS